MYIKYTYVYNFIYHPKIEDSMCVYLLSGAINDFTFMLRKLCWYCWLRSSGVLFFFSFYKYIYYIIYYNIYSFSFLLHDQVSNEIEQFVFFFLRNELILLAPNRSEVKLPNNPKITKENELKHGLAYSPSG